MSTDPNYVYDWSPYHYKLSDGTRNGGPTLWICCVFVALFGLSTTAHLGQAVFTKRWFLLPTLVLGGIGEVIGWSARLWSAKNVISNTAFLMQISTTIIAPTFLSAANFIILGRIINLVGPSYSRLSARNYAIIFVVADTVALVIQAIGGGMASSAVTSQGQQNGGNIMLAGIIIQLVAITIYAGLAGDFLFRVIANRPVRKSPLDVPLDSMGPGYVDSNEDIAKRRNEGRLQSGMVLMLAALSFSTLCLFIRSIYRTIELSDGWAGRIISTEVYFNILDGMMVAFSMIILNVLHPSFLVY